MSTGNSFFTLAQMMNVEFDSTHLWSIMIEDAPAPFNNWFPAVNFDEDVYNIRTDTYDIGNEQFEMATGFGGKTCRLEAYDNENEVLLKWLRNWVDNKMYITDGKYQGMNYIDNYCKTIQVKKYNYKQTLVSQRDYVVTPIGSLKITRTNTPQPAIISIDLRIQSTKIVK